MTQQPCNAARVSRSKEGLQQGILVARMFAHLVQTCQASMDCFVPQLSPHPTLFFSPSRTFLQLSHTVPVTAVTAGPCTFPQTCGTVPSARRFYGAAAFPHFGIIEQLMQQGRLPVSVALPSKRQFEERAGVGYCWTANCRESDSRGGKTVESASLKPLAINEQSLDSISLNNSESAKGGGNLSTWRQPRQEAGGWQKDTWQAKGLFDAGVSATSV